VEVLRACWGQVLAADRADGILAAGVARFARDGDAHLSELAGQVSTGAYTPGGVDPG
jgi:hypothetical protein